MPELQLYEYAVIRVVPRVEREEFVNAGIILLCKKKGLIACRIQVPATKLSCLDPKLDLETINAHLEAFQKIAAGDPLSASPIARLDPPSRFRWLTATRSTIVQCSRVHPGLSPDCLTKLEELLRELVD